MKSAGCHKALRRGVSNGDLIGLSNQRTHRHLSPHAESAMAEEAEKVGALDSDGERE